jgi:hypothetical protein
MRTPLFLLKGEMLLEEWPTIARIKPKVRGHKVILGQAHVSARQVGIYYCCYYKYTVIVLARIAGIYIGK